ncbi:hypothetical protein ABA45_11790 [Marinobacter psychrophilus]|uniref:Polysaccharide pyruvyl transferase domain-containing protein n=1 Tax=Marinobacter psychrophilus TaxID=330734 RepID=A0A0H4I5J0_9GAMM|nr:hypothetical protein ABA45_11790 [Marinobacter psychrophilus]
MERSEALVTGRYHAVAYAILLKKKFLAIESNTPKITFLLNDVGFDNSRIIEIKEDAKELPFIPDFTKEEIEKLDNFLIMAKKCRENLEKDLLAVVYKNSAYV